MHSVLAEALSDCPPLPTPPMPKIILPFILLGFFILFPTTGQAQIRVKTYPSIKASYSTKSIQLSNANNETVESLLNAEGTELRLRMNKAELGQLLDLMRRVRAYTERLRRGERITYADEIQVADAKIQLTKYITSTDSDYVLCYNSQNQEVCLGLKPSRLSQLNELYREIHRDLFDLNQSESTPPPSRPTTLTQSQPAQAIETPPPPPPPTETIYQSVEEPPVLIGGIPALLANLKYPTEAAERNIEGVVIVAYVVDETGTVRNAEVIQSLGYGCDEEAMHLISNARFLPGLKHGNPVKVKQYMPFTFRIHTQN